MSRIVNGLVAGAVGTSLLNIVTYADMALRGRPSSSIPDEDVDALSDRTGIRLGGDAETAAARREGLGALLGYVTGATGGAVFGLLRPLAPSVPWPLAAVLTGATIMAATDASSTALGTTDPRSWSPSSWAADAIPHIAYGAGVVLTFDALER